MHLATIVQRGRRTFVSRPGAAHHWRAAPPAVSPAGVIADGTQRRTGDDGRGSGLRR
ncbi:hypothetical protein [Streptomyces corynorhini]|uniref:hypothetical protein n=1 Tax=Streptomyces corynorhini TaxID=2282652 RepID=UPI0013140C87|nr:hypothetical protein [Streptomyces corynorhini]